MRKVTLLICVLIGLTLIGTLGCKNPAEGKTEAVVKEAEGSTQDVGGGVRFVFSDDSAIGFTGSKITGSHEGGFRSFEGEIVLVGGDPTASAVNVTIDTTSLWSDDDRLTGHLMSPDFFDVEKFPTATFTSTGITAGEEGFTISGDLDLHGVTKNISFPATIEVGQDGISAQAEFFIKRFDFDIVYAGKPDDLIRDEVVIRLDLKGVPAA